jgi:HD superfamily phosphodiesterase
MFGTYKRIHELAWPYLQTRQNVVHIEICYEFARRLLEEEPGDPEIVLPAIICHDVGWIMLSEDLQRKAFGPTFDPKLRRIHEVEGVRLARQVLTEVGYDPEKTEEILEIIDGHDSRSTALSDSDKIVKDADKLFRYEPRGLSIDMRRFGLEATSYISWLTGQIEPWFFTETGKRFACHELRKQAVCGTKKWGEFSPPNA